MDIYKKGEKKKDRYFVLCNDLLLVCKAAGFNKGRFLLSKRLPAGMFLVNSTPGETSNKQLVITIIYLLFFTDSIVSCRFKQGHSFRIDSGWTGEMECW